MTGSSLPVITSRAELAASRAATAEALCQLANEPELLPRRPELLGLADAIREGGQAESGWRGANLAEIFHPDRAISQPQHIGGGVLGVLATVIVFFPIAWTWFGLKHALEAYRDVIVPGSRENRSFLQLWVQGFDGTLPSYLALPEVAFGSVLLIGSSILLVLLDRMRQNWREAAGHRRWQQLAARLSSTILLAEQTVRVGSAESADDLMASTRDAAESIATGGLLLAALVKDLQSLAVDLRDGIVTASSGLELSVKNAAGEFEGAVTNAGASLQSAAGSALSDLTDSVRVIASAARTQAQAADSANTASNALASASHAIDENTAAMTTTISGLKDSLESALKPVVSSLESRIHDLNAHTSAIEDALSHYTGALQAQYSELTQIRAELARLKMEPSSLKLASAPSAAL